MQMFGEFSEESKSPEVDQSCLFHCSLTQTGILHLIRAEWLWCVCVFCDYCFLMRRWQLRCFFLLTCVCICLGPDRAADVLSAKNRTHVSLHSSKTVLNPPHSPVLLHYVASRLEAIHYLLAFLPESLHQGPIWLFLKWIIVVYLVS